MATYSELSLEPSRALMQTLLIHQAFAGPDEPGGTRHFELAQHLADAGVGFTVITSRRSYLTGESRRMGESAGEAAVGSSLRVITAPSLGGVHRSFVRRVLGFFSFAASSVVLGVRQRGVDVVLGTSPPIFQAASAWLVAFLKRVPFVLEVRDLWPEFAIDMGVLTNPVLIRLSRWLEKFLYRRADHIVVNSPAYREYLLEHAVPDDKITVVPNGVDTAVFEPASRGEDMRQEWGVAADEFVVTYAGALGMANDIPTLLHAADKLKDRPVRIVLVGDGKERRRLEEQAAQMGLDNVLFAGTVPKAELPDVLAASDACVATLMAIPMFRTTYPNKVFDYMAAGRPTILGIDGVIREVVESADGGICVPPGDSETLAQAILRLSEDSTLTRRFGDNARRYVCQHFERADQARLFGETLRAVAKGSG